MTRLLPKLCVSTASALGATTFAALQGRGVFTCVATYLLVGQATFAGSVACDLLKPEKPRRASGQSASNEFRVPGPRVLDAGTIEQP